MTGGTYTLIVERVAAGTVDVGALGELSLPAGWYAYTGSALGPGGFSRVDRHRRVASGDTDVRHWHVDYLLGDAATRLADGVRSADVDAECLIAGQLDGERIADFGCSDCECPSHLVVRENRDDLVETVQRAHSEARNGG
jgi:endonuclease-3